RERSGQGSTIDPGAHQVPVDRRVPCVSACVAPQANVTHVREQCLLTVFTKASGHYDVKHRRRERQRPDLARETGCSCTHDTTAAESGHTKAEPARTCARSHTQRDQEDRPTTSCRARCGGGLTARHRSEMGMTAPALYRYVSGIDALLVLITADMFDELADAIIEADSGFPEESTDRRILASLRAFRRWAVEHRTEFAVMFGPRTQLAPGVDVSPALEAG